MGLVHIPLEDNGAFMIEIVYLDDDVIVCIKPAGLLSEGEGEERG